MKNQPVLVIHGGAGSKVANAARREELSRSLERILRKVFSALKRGASAAQAVTMAVQELEDDPLYNAGKGSKIQSDGHIRMSASIMDGYQRRFAGCVNVEGLKNPILLAKALLKRHDRVLAEAGAARYARELGLPFTSPFTELQRENFRKAKKGKSGTVGAVALDLRGRLAAATSTGGRGFEYPHRVSDSPTVAGNFANEFCAVSATGTGEQIVEFAAAATICAFVESGTSNQAAVQRLLRKARRQDAEFGLISLDAKGRVVADTTTPFLIWAAAGPKGFSGFWGRDITE